MGKNEKENLFENLVSQQIGGYSFKNPALLKQAFTRKSYTEENGGQNNEVLEFIGDKVLDIAVVRYLTKRFGTDLHIQELLPKFARVPQKPQEFECKLSEGELTKLKQRMVEKKALAARIDELGFAQYLIMGKGDREKDIAQQLSVKEDLFEAILGAVALDSNWDFEAIQNVVEIMLIPDSFIEDDEEADYVSLIYEWEARTINAVPWFMYFDGGVSRHWYFKEENVIYADPEGTYNLNNCNKACRIKLRDDLKIIEAYGKSKNEARKAACKRAYQYLEDEGLLYSIKDEIDNPNTEDAIGQLEILARRDYFSIPTYEFEENHDEDGNPVWSAKCKIEEIKRSFSSVDSSKKQAKKQAAYKMLKFVLEHYEEA